jgi:hypothetical protein
LGWKYVRVDPGKDHIFWQQRRSNEYEVKAGANREYAEREQK